VSKNFTMATIAGAVVLFVTGYLIFGWALTGFYESNAGSASGVMKESVGWLWIIMSTIAYAALLACILGWAGSKDVAAGFKTAAVVGLLIGISVTWGQYAFTNLNNMTLTLVDPVLGAIHSGIGGAVIGMMLGKGGGD
jgi:hypothetical protein